MNSSMNSWRRNFLVWGVACAAAWGVGFALRHLGKTHEPETAAGQLTVAEPRPSPAKTGEDLASGLLAAGSPWQESLALERLTVSLKPEEWAPLMRTLQKKNRYLAQTLLLRWLEADPEAALVFVAQSTRASGSAGLERVAAKYLAVTDPERGWKWAGELKTGYSNGCRAELLAALCEHDPVAAARLVTAHGASEATWGVAFPDMPAASAGPAVKALAAEPDSLLKKRMLLHTMSDWASKDFTGALDWWRQQPPALQGLTLRGLGMALHILSPTEGSFYSKGPVRLSAADLTAMADTALDHAPPEDRRDFFARFLIHMSPTDPVTAVEWVAANLHGKERRDRLDSALAYIQPKGALEVVTAWERLPQTGWPDNTFNDLAAQAAKADPARTLDWVLKLPASWAGDAAGPTGSAWGRQNAETARRMTESLTDNTPASAAFAAGVADALVETGIYSLAASGRNPAPEEISEKLASVWEWASDLPGARGVAASSRVLASWVEVNPAGAAQAASGLIAPEARAGGLRAVTERFFLKAPDAALAWAGQLTAPDREIVRSVLANSRLPEEVKTESLAKVAAQGLNPR